jgi:DNA primase
MIHHRQTNKAELITELERVGAVVKGSTVKCPFHKDGNPSASIFQGKDSIWRFHCHACDVSGDVFDIESRRTGEPLAAILKKYTHGAGVPNIKPISPAESKPEKVFDGLDAIYKILETKHSGKLEALHEYQTVDGKHHQYVIRWRKADGTKRIWPAVKTDKGILLKFPDNRILYRLPDIQAAEIVVVCEGESKADILGRYGFTATCSSGGSNAAGRTGWTPLAGKRIVVWPDADLPGHGYAADVQRILREQNPPAQVAVINPADIDLRDGEDVVDYVRQLQAAGYDELAIKKSLAEVIAKAKTSGPAAELESRFENIFSGRQRSIETGFSTLDRMIQILPDSITLTAGAPGASKSLLMLQLAARWIQLGIRTAIFELEKDTSFHLSRVLAQKAGISDITNTRWAEANPEIVRQALNEHRDFLDSFGRSIWTCPDKIVTQGDVVQWTKKRAENGFQAIIIDPATIADRKDEPYRADGLFMQELRAIAREHRTAIFLVIHPTKCVVTMPDLMLISGGAAYSRFCDNTLWLDIHESKTSTVLTACGSDKMDHNRTVHVLKSRDGSGTGARLAYQFDAASLTLRELGLIMRDKGKV